MKKLSESYQPNLSELITQLNTTISYYNQQYGLNQGGCAFLTAIIADELESHNIPYQVVAYADQDVDMSDLNQVVDNGELKHMSIIIDDTEVNGVDPSDMRNQKWTRQIYDTLTSDDLYLMYDSCDWNGEWEVKRNKQLKSEIIDVFNFIL